MILNNFYGSSSRTYFKKEADSLFEFSPCLSAKPCAKAGHGSLNDAVSHPYTGHRNGDTAGTKRNTEKTSARRLKPANYNLIID